VTVVFVPPRPSQKVAGARALLVAAGALFLASTAVGRALTVVEPGVHDAELFRLFGDAWLDGRIPYRDLWNNKPPGIFAVAAVIRSLSPIWSAGVVAFEALAVCVSCFAVYRVVRETRPSHAALPALAAAGAAAVALNLAALNEGGFTTELAVAPFAALSALEFVRGWREASRRSWVASGALAGAAGLFKPPGLAPLLAALTFVGFAAARASRARSTRGAGGAPERLSGGRGAFQLGSGAPPPPSTRVPPPRMRDAAAALLGGAALTWAPVLLYFGVHGAALDMLDATFLFNFGYAAANRSGPLSTLARTGVTLLPVAPLALAAGALAFATLRDRRTREGASIRVFVLLWVAWDLVGLAAGGRFYGHYVLAAIPSLAVAAGLWLAELSQPLGRLRVAVAAGALVLPLLALQLWEARALSPAAAAGRPEPYWTASVDAILRQRATLRGSHTLFTWDYLPAIYVHSGLPPALRHPCAPIWGRRQVRDAVTLELLSALERTRPMFMVDGGIRGPVPGRDPEAFQRYQSILNRSYRLLFVDPLYGLRVFERVGGG
jgi:hypothetical protein